MKRVSAILFAVAYLVLSAGSVFSIHRCMERIVDVGVFAAKGDSCCGGFGYMTGCCQNQEITVSIDDQNITPSIGYFLQPVAAQQAETIELSPQNIKDPSPPYSTGNVLPARKVPVWLFNCSLTYYG